MDKEDELPLAQAAQLHQASLASKQSPGASNPEPAPAAQPATGLGGDVAAQPRPDTAAEVMLGLYSAVSLFVPACCLLCIGFDCTRCSFIS